MGVVTAEVTLTEALKEIEQLRAEVGRLTDRVDRSQAQANRLRAENRQLKALQATEITQEELIGRGLELPQDRLTFPVEQYAQHRAQLNGKGGVYTFYHGAEGYLYVGVSANLGTRLRDHINGTIHGNKELYQKLQALSGVIVTVYLEPDSGKRELYENYLILRYSPGCNKAKISKEHDGYTWRHTQEIQDTVVRLYKEGKTYREIKDITGIFPHNTVSILKENGVTLSRVKQMQDAIKERNNLIIALYLNKATNGLTNHQIAEAVGCTYAVVANVTERYNRQQRARQAGTN